MQLESVIDEGTPDTPGHWRTLYIRWATGESDGPRGLTLEEVLDVLVARASEILDDHDSSQIHDTASGAAFLVEMLYADKYGIEVQAQAQASSQNEGTDETPPQELYTPEEAQAFAPPF